MTAARMATEGTLSPRGAPWRALALFLVLAPLSAAPAKEAGLALVASEQASLSRLTLDAPKTLAPRIEATRDTLVLRLPKGSAVDLSPLGGRTPRRVAEITSLPDGLRIVARPGSQIRHHRIGDRIIVEVTDAPAEAGTATPAVTTVDLADRPGAAELRLAALPQRIATDAPAVAPAGGPRAALVARPAEVSPRPPRPLRSCWPRPPACRRCPPRPARASSIPPRPAVPGPMARPMARAVPA